MPLTATPATRHHEQHLSQDCGDRSRGNGRSWRFALRLSVLFSAVSLLLELPSAASGLGRRSPTPLGSDPTSQTPLSLDPRPPTRLCPGSAFSDSPQTGHAFHSPAPWSVSLSSVQPLSEHCFSQFSFFSVSNTESRALTPPLTAQVLQYLTLSPLETPPSRVSTLMTPFSRE